MRELLNQLHGIGETQWLYHDEGKGRPHTGEMLIDHSTTAKELGELFGVDR
jgi:hypothetical protein